jgi:hypothetical protein
VPGDDATGRVNKDRGSAGTPAQMRSPVGHRQAKDSYVQHRVSSESRWRMC